MKPCRARFCVNTRVHSLNGTIIPILPNTLHIPPFTTLLFVYGYIVYTCSLRFIHDNAHTHSRAHGPYLHAGPGITHPRNQVYFIHGSIHIHIYQPNARASPLSCCLQNIALACLCRHPTIRLPASHRPTTTLIRMPLYSIRTAGRRSAHNRSADGRPAPRANQAVIACCVYCRHAPHIYSRICVGES